MKQTTVSVVNFTNILRAAFAPAFFQQKIVKSYRKVWRNTLEQKAAHKMLLRLTPGLDFINVLRTAFALVDPKSVRTQSSLQYHFTLLGSTSVKAVRRKLLKLTPEGIPQT